MCREARVVRYGFAACGAVSGVVPLAAGCAPDEATGFPGVPAGASGELIVATAELTPLWGVTLIPLAAGCPPNEAAGFPGARAGASG
jgi:hypothetical protein